MTVPIAEVRVRLFASAKAAAGVGEWTARVPSDGTLADALATLPTTPGEDLDRVLARCSFLVNAESTTDRSTPLAHGDRVDVLPPFAGG